MGRTVVLGLDAFHEGLLKYTPTIQELYNKNPSGPLKSTEPPVTAPAWASFQTAKNQGKHGIYDFVTYDDEYELSFLDGNDLHTRTFYELLASDGHDCLLFNLPFALPPRIDGDIVPSWLDSSSADPVPTDLYTDYGIDAPRYPDFTGSRAEKIADISACFEHNTDQFLTLLDAEDHDFLFQLVSATDWMQHNAFRQLHHEPDSEVANAGRDLLQQVDEYIERVQSSLSDDDTLILLSDHGFRLFDGVFYMNDWLSEQGFLTRGETTLGKMSQDDVQTINLGTLGQLLAKQEWIYPVLRRVKATVEPLLGVEFNYEDGIDFDKSVAYCLSKDDCSIRVDDALPDERRAEVVEAIIDGLADEEGISASRREDVYQGPYTDEAGDIIVHSETFKASRGPVGRVRTGEPYEYHSKSGFLTVVGTGADASDVEAELIDVAPTILAMFGVPIPEDIDGEPIQPLLTEDVEYRSYPDDGIEFKTGNGETKDAVEDRLSNLGYL